jgi:hypothetical protein
MYARMNTTGPSGVTLILRVLLLIERWCRFLNLQIEAKASMGVLRAESGAHDA